MPNIKSQEKRVRTSQKRSEVTKSERTKIRHAIKSVRTAVANNDKDAAATALKHACSLLDKSIDKGIYHPNYAKRQKSRLSKVVNGIGKVEE